MAKRQNPEAEVTNGIADQPQQQQPPTNDEQKQPPQVKMPSDQAGYDQAIAAGLEVLATTNSKAAAAREIYRQLHQEHREVVLRALIEGATVTPKGAPTYFYNISRKFRKLDSKTKKDTVV